MALSSDRMQKRLQRTVTESEIDAVLNRVEGWPSISFSAAREVLVTGTELQCMNETEEAI